MEQRTAAESATYQEGVTNLLTPRIFFEAMMVKACPGVIDDAAQISVADGARGRRVAENDRRRLGDRTDGADRGHPEPDCARVALVEGTVAEEPDHFD